MRAMAQLPHTPLSLRPNSHTAQFHTPQPPLAVAQATDLRRGFSMGGLRFESADSLSPG